ncbi:hypothetical protein Droror1_Dr00009251 [Drosera rotundifolia]
MPWRELLVRISKAFSVANRSSRGLLRRIAKKNEDKMDHVDMGKLIGLLKVRVRRGVNLAVRDAVSETSDPYVVVSVESQKLKTRVIHNDCNPYWNDELTLTISDPSLPIKLTVYDKDTLTDDDKMGRAEFDIRPYLECLQMGLGKLPIGTAVKKIQPDKGNHLADESKVIWIGDGKMVQDMVLKLQDVERGLVQIQIEWVDVLIEPKPGES